MNASGNPQAQMITLTILTYKSIGFRLTYMSINAELLNKILLTASQQGLDQARLAARAKVRPETISRAKKRGTVDLDTLESLAEAVGLQLTMQPLKVSTEAPTSPLAHPRYGLAWSNPNATAEALVCNAIKNGNFYLLLESVSTYGLDFVRRQFDSMASSLRLKSRAEIQRKLANIEKGFACAQA